MQTKIIILILLTSFLVAGCGSKGNMPALDTNVHKGTDGLVIAFLPNAPPAKASANEELPIGIEAANKGAFDISQGYLSITVEKDYMALQKGELAFPGFKDPVTGAESPDNEKQIGAQDLNLPIGFSIAGKSIYNPTGDKGTITVVAKAKKIDPQSETHTSDIIATACYPYQTLLTETLCIDSDIYNLKPLVKACKVADITPESQGAPIAITKIETKMLPLDTGKIKPQFTLYVENKGNGEVISREKLSAFCGSSDLSYGDWNKLIPTALLGDTELKCRTAQTKETVELKLKSKKGIIVCTLGEGEGLEKKAAFKTILKVTLEYGYMATISKSTIIEKFLI